LCSNLFGNPHSASPSSALSTERTESVRLRVLEFFKADPEHFDVVFVANATAAIKMVMHAFQDCASKSESQQQSGFWYGYHSDAHTSLVGVRQVAFSGSRCFKSDDEVEAWLEGKSDSVQDSHDCPANSKLGLFAYPAQSNMNGHRLPLSWAGRVRQSPHARHKNMFTMLDAAAYVSTAQLDLSNADTAPDFTALSFYKIFGFPDLGALIVRKSAGHILQQRRYFGGGTVEMVIVIDTAWHAKKKHELHEELEDGTLPFHNIIALDAALDTHERIYGSMTRVSAHACYLAKVLYEGLKTLKHSNGLSVCEIYKHAASTYGDSTTQAPTVAFNVRNSQGGWVGKSDVEQLAIVRGIQLRTGGVCNPGGIATCLALKPWEMRKNFAEGMRCGNDVDLLGGKPTGIVRVSLGAMSNRGDVEHFLRFVQEVFVESKPIPAWAVEQRTAPGEPNRVESIRVYPLRGGRGWEVPPNTAWEIKEAGLAWDQEWCLVSQATGESLTVDSHPRLRHLEPSLHVEDGYLKISLPEMLKKTTESEHEVYISLWESPPTHPDRLLQPHAFSQRADAYPSPSLAAFFTEFLGFPCTLARYPDHRMLVSQGVLHKTPRQTPSSNRRNSVPRSPSVAVSAHEQPRRASSLVADLGIESSITISTSSESSAHNCNITTATSLNSTNPSWQHIRIGPHYFLSLGYSPCTSNSHRLRHLPNLFDLSVQSQHPTIRLGDEIKIVSPAASAQDANADAGLHACMASSFAADFICPVPACRKEMNTLEAKREHLILVHRTGKTPPSPQPVQSGDGPVVVAVATGMRRRSWGWKFALASVIEVGEKGSSRSSAFSEKGIKADDGWSGKNHSKGSRTLAFRAMIRRICSY
jgi:molybdenum cofactor sulfurtransferase